MSAHANGATWRATLHVHFRGALVSSREMESSPAPAEVDRNGEVSHKRRALLPDCLGVVPRCVTCLVLRFCNYPHCRPGSAKSGSCRASGSNRSVGSKARVLRWLPHCPHAMEMTIVKRLDFDMGRLSPQIPTPALYLVTLAPFRSREGRRVW
ncbi:hypothetical protein BDY17DRAFT_14944 [Neohortaea acidophila]|uniref:Uncharacterized protein n=1 Tax=Neohortaea acidophila TaxID=245834 RepID=A0A6A6Q6N0_9PEZI|nr:uncharacterized protein BDY17DRAFT_14944 [Neohortaea acidophila]KAF2487626.1 hypothetical protein BDY17DRAFT_14944 [Neohortaea acidophila]